MNDEAITFLCAACPTKCDTVHITDGCCSTIQYCRARSQKALRCTHYVYRVSVPTRTVEQKMTTSDFVIGGGRRCKIPVFFVLWCTFTVQSYYIHMLVRTRIQTDVGPTNNQHTHCTWNLRTPDKVRDVRQTAARTVPVGQCHCQ
jgi:hypothetical protein